MQVISGSSYGFDQPVAISSDGSDVWVANESGNSVTELDAATGGLVQVLSGSNDGFHDPTGISADGTHVWVANEGESVTELNASTGVLVRVISTTFGPTSGPYAVSSDGTNVWVSDPANNSVTEIGAASGGVVQVISGSSYGFDDPFAISSDGTDVWVANDGGNSVTELSAATGGLVQVISNSSYGFDNPLAVSSDGTNVWVENPTSDSVTELNATDGALVEVLSLPSGTGQPTAVSSDGTNVWVASSGNAVIDISANSPPGRPGQSITFTSTPPAVTFPEGPTYSVSASGGGSANPVLFSSANPFVCQVSGSTVSFVSGGTCTIDANQAGNASYAPARTAAQSFVVDPCSAAMFTSPDSATATAGTPFTFTATTCHPLTGAPKFKAGGLPPGLTLSGNGDNTATISGTPSARDSGVYSATLTAVAPNEPAATQKFAVTVDNAPVFKSKAAITVHTGSPFTYAVTTANGWPVPSVSTASLLPTGVKLTDNGNGTASLAGTPGPGTGGVYVAAISATTSAGERTNQEFVLTVYQPPAITSAASDSVTRGVSMTPFSVTTSGYPAPTLKSVHLPVGLTLNGNTISGTTEAAAGTYKASIVATSKAGSTTQAFTLTVDP